MTGCDIPHRQNTEPFLVLLRARSQFFKEAKRLQWTQFCLTVMVPICLGLIAIFSDSVRSVAAAVTLIITVVDATWMDRRLRQLYAIPVRVSERFDCLLYDLPWRVLIAGKPVDHEEIVRSARRWSAGDAKLIDWYPVAVGRAPRGFARFVCQRTNLWYDSTLRRGYAKKLMIGAWSALAIFVALAIINDLNLINFVLSVVPTAPLMIWAIREALRQQDAAAANETLKSEVESALDRWRTQAMTAEEAEARAREIQDGIFLRRVGASPMLLEKIYHWRRNEMEGQMNEGADELVTRAGY